MRFESLKVQGLMGCEYEIEFDPKYTVVIGSNRQGKTLTARLIMLALYGTGARERGLHDSWKLRSEELLPTSEHGSVELVLENEGRSYKFCRGFSRVKGEVRGEVEAYKQTEGFWGLVCRKENEVKALLEEEVGLTPGLANVIMSNEQSLVGAVAYDDKLQASVWEGWKWRSEIIRDNLRKARDKCSREGREFLKEIEDLKDTLDSIKRKWQERGIFSQWEIEFGLNKVKLEQKLNLIEQELSRLEEKIGHYSDFFNALISLDDLESKGVISSLLDSFKREKGFIEEKEEIEKLEEECKSYLELLTQIQDRGGKEGIERRLGELEDEEKKLKAARTIKERKEKPLKVECDIYPPEEGLNLIIQIPDEVATRFKYEEITAGGVAVPYDEKKEGEILTEKAEINALKEKFAREKERLKAAKDDLRDKIRGKEAELRNEQAKLKDQKAILEADKDRFLKTFEEIKEDELKIKKLEAARTRFDRLYSALSEEESLKRIRKETVAFINRIYEKTYEWDINAKLAEDDKVIVTDDHGNVRSHPSGSEIHIMGLAWRWMVARGFDLPLVLDELDVLLDEKNFERTRKLIEEEMDRQTIILTLKEGLKELPGKIYKVTREGNISTLVPLE